ncbi:unnamed protein product [Lymnaea stagnalis]|uniref:Uncharacterized protein n=1 Tax=Lymnaea stagnalis TaxID=6523 RepID=A0AAV2ITG0_LYMST
MCTIQGSKVKMTAVDINVQAKLPWESDPAMNIDPYRSVFSVSSDGDGVLWQSSQCTETSDCRNLHILNTNLFMPPSEDSSQVSVTYSDFGLYGQNVWVEVIGQGSALNVTCTSKPLPPNRFITSTTSSTTTTPPTTPSVITTSPATNTSMTTTTPPTTIVPITKPATTSTIPGKTSLANSTPSIVVYPPTIPTIWMTHLSTKPPPILTTTIRKTTPTMEDLRGDKSNHDSTALVIILVCILLVLVITALVVGYLVNRKRRKFTYNGKVGLKALFLSLYHQMTNREQEEKTDYQDSPFDPIAMDDFKQPTSTPKSKPHYEGNDKKTLDAAVLAMTDDESKNKQRSGDTTEGKHSSRSHAQQESEKESDLNEKADKEQASSVTIYNEIHQSGYGIVEAEIERMQQLRNQKPNEVSMENSLSSSSVSDSKTGSGQGNGRNYLNSSQDKNIHEDHDQRRLTTNSQINLTETNCHFGVDEPETLESSAAEIKIKHDAGLKKHHKIKRDEPRRDKPKGEKPKGGKTTGEEQKGDKTKKDIDLKHYNQPHDHMLLSPEEQKMFVSLGLTSLDASSEWVPDVSNTGVTGVGQDAGQNRGAEAHVPNNILKQFPNNEMANQDEDVEKKYSLAKSSQSGDLEKSGNQTMLPKKHKLSKSDLVSTILQLSLQDIKHMRTIEHQKGDIAGGDNQTKDMSDC